MAHQQAARRERASIQQLSFDQIAGPACQRWRGGVPTWRRPEEGGFDRRQYEIAEIPDDTTAQAFIEQEHYTHKYPAALCRCGLWRKGKLVGVGVFSAPTNKLTLTNPFPDLVAYRESMELGRFVLLDEVESNGETHFLKECFRLLKRRGVLGVVSFSDPVARKDIKGNVTFKGHYGHIYQSSSALFAGRGTSRTLLLLPDGQTLNDRSLQKVRAQESGHKGVERELVKYGAQPLQSGDDPCRWLKEALQTIGVRRLDHPGPYRYLFNLGGRVIRPRIGVVTFPYPQRDEGDPQ